MKIVNRVGADEIPLQRTINSYFGLNAGIAKEIINYRNENGKFTNRNQFKDVKR